MVWHLLSFEQSSSGFYGKGDEVADGRERLEVIKKVVVIGGGLAVATILSSLLLIYLFFRKQIPKTYDAQAADALTRGKPGISPRLLRISLATLVAIDVGYVLTSLSRVPVSLVI